MGSQRDRASAPGGGRKGSRAGASPALFLSLAAFAIGAALFLGERLSGAKVAAAVLGLLGFWVVARPDFAALDLGVAAAAASAVCFAATAILTKALTRGESIVSILFWLTLIQLILGLATAGWDGAIALPTPATLPWLALIGVCGLVAHFCLTTALSLAPASTVVPVDFARLPVIAAVGWFLYGEAVGLNVWLGACLIFAAILLNLRATARPPSRAAAQQ
ncbi:MAG TPA: DMT family transporter [Paracoccaceae bacterium]|nr:DMT family transporter [Paracoccaceae bacterium]